MRPGLKSACELLWLAWFPPLGLGSWNFPSILNFLLDKPHYHYGCYNTHYFSHHFRHSLNIVELHRGADITMSGLTVIPPQTGLSSFFAQISRGLLHPVNTFKHTVDWVKPNLNNIRVKIQNTRISRKLSSSTAGALMEWNAQESEYLLCHCL